MDGSTPWWRREAPKRVVLLAIGVTTFLANLVLPPLLGGFVPWMLHMGDSGWWGYFAGSAGVILVALVLLAHAGWSDRVDVQGEEQ